MVVLFGKQLFLLSLCDANKQNCIPFAVLKWSIVQGVPKVVDYRPAGPRLYAS